MIIKEIKIEQFRKFRDQTFKVGNYLTAIAGRNKTLKSTLLGILTQPFSITNADSPLYGCKTLDGYNFRSQFKEKFKFDKTEMVGSHAWEITLTEEASALAKYNPFKLISIPRSQKDQTIRFWHPTDRSKGSGYIQAPVYFLSLSRLFPVGETALSAKTIRPANLSPEEQTQFNQEYAKILTDQETILNTTYGKDKKITSVGVNTQDGSHLTNSAGQSNIARIILAVFSFQRLKNTNPTGYKGGILAIDEIDATLHPSAQKHLIKFLHKYAKELDLQIIFTTHSQHILEELREMVLKDQNPDNNKVLYLRIDRKPTDSIIKILETKKIKDFNMAISDLKLLPYEAAKINVFCEDPVTRNLLSRTIGSEYYKRIKPIATGIGCGEYMKLHKSPLKEFKNALIILDGDVKKENQKIKKWINRSKNVLSLPDDTCPEISFYDMLQDPQNFIEFNKSRKSEDSADVLFQSFMPTSKPTRHQDVKDFCKNWFKSLSTKDKNAIYSTWKKLHAEECNIFKNKFKEQFNAIAEKMMIEPIE